MEIQLRQHELAELENGSAATPEAMAGALEILAKLLRENNLRIMEAANLAMRARNLRSGLTTVETTPSTEAVLVEKDCPFCAEKVKAKAVLCKHCGSSLVGNQSHSPVSENIRREKENKNARQTGDKKKLQVLLITVIPVEILVTMLAISGALECDRQFKSETRKFAQLTPAVIRMSKLNTQVRAATAQAEEAKEKDHEWAERIKAQALYEASLSRTQMMQHQMLMQSSDRLSRETDALLRQRIP